MRVRVVFWVAQGCACLGILAFAVFRNPATPLVVKTRLALSGLLPNCAVLSPRGVFCGLKVSFAASGSTATCES